MSVTEFALYDFAELDTQNLKQVDLRWDIGPSIEEVLSVLKTWRNLQRLTFDGSYIHSFEVLCDFIMAMEHLKYFFLAFICDGSDCDQLKPLREKITQFVSSHRPNFVFDTTC